eukprot:2220894-Pyramimonas_sp.AAC.1
MRPELTACSSNRAMYCVRCAKTCDVVECDIHVAGTPCTDHSMYGLQRRMHGPRAKLFWAWIAQRRTLREKIWVQENVESFGGWELEEELGDLYVVVRM